MPFGTIIAVSVVASCALCVYGIASFGDGMTFQVLLQACNRLNSDICDGNIATATLSLTVALILTSPIQLYGVGVFIGVRILMINEGMILSRVLGGLLYIVLLQKVLADVYSTAADPTAAVELLKKYKFSSWYSYAIVWCTGLSSGILSGLFGAAGPPLIIFSSTLNIEKNVTRGTVAFCDVVVNICRAAAFVYLFVLGGHGGADTEGTLGGFSPHDWAFFCTLVTAGALCGLGVGNILATVINQLAFKYILLSILGAGALMLASVGLTPREVSALVSVELGTCIVLVVAVFTSVKYFQRSTSPPGIVVDYQVVSTDEEDMCLPDEKIAIGGMELTSLDGHRL